MAIRVITEALLEGVFFTYVKKAWDALKKNVPQDMGGKIVDKVMKEGGLDDNQGMALAMAKAGLDKKKRERIVRAIIRLEDMNKKFSNNVRRILANSRVPTKETRKKDGTVIIEPIPGAESPGQILVKDLANCKSDAEIDLLLLSWGVAEEAPDGTWDKTQLWIRQEAWPWVLDFLKSVDDLTLKKIQDFQEIQTQRYRSRQVIREIKRDMPLWKKIFNPALWLETIRRN